jgi:hypothetical protein
LFDFTIFFPVFDDLQILIVARFFYSGEHGSLLAKDTPKVGGINL